MILLADSGSTGCDWVLLASDHSVPWRHRTDGINPVYQSIEEIRLFLQQELLSLLQDYRISKVFFYGAGCIPSKIQPMQQLFEELLPAATASVYSDIWAAIHALCGHEEGIACILGTGSNSCLFDGEQIIQQTPSLGYVLGDEASAAYLGRNFLGLLLKDQFPAGMKQDFLDTYSISIDEIIDQVYRRPFPNRFLASFSPYIYMQSHIEPVANFLLDSFVAFLRRNVVPYNRPDLPVNFVGSVAHYYRSFLGQALKACSMLEGEIVQSPIEGLIRYYSK